MLSNYLRDVETPVFLKLSLFKGLTPNCLPAGGPVAGGRGKQLRAVVVVVLVGGVVVVVVVVVVVGIVAFVVVAVFVVVVVVVVLLVVVVVVTLIRSRTRNRKCQ